MDKRISYAQAMEIAERFARRVHAELDSQAEVYLFGSVVTSTNHPKSDIAVVSREFTNDVCKNYARVNMLAYDIDDNIDAQAIIYEDWVDQTPFTANVQKLGILVR